jgi:protein-tyrosine kinase
MNKSYQDLLRTELNRITSGEPPTQDFSEKAAQAVQIEFQPSQKLFATGAPVDAQEMPWDPNLQNLPTLEQRTSTAEQFRRLRSRLIEFRSQQALKVVLVSSAHPQEGKSFVTANLSVALSHHRGTRVLLIDGDMRRYSLHNYLGTSARPGLADFLSGAAEPWEVMQKADKSTVDAHPGLAQLTFIAGGGLTDQVADLSHDSRFGDLIDYARPLFDWILVDTSPVTLVSDAVSLARYCDGVLLVVRSGMTRYQDAQKAQIELQASTVLGVVLNAVEERAVPTYYGYSPEK